MAHLLLIILIETPREVSELWLMDGNEIKKNSRSPTMMERLRHD